MPEKKILFEQLEAKVRELVAADPEHVYQPVDLRGPDGDTFKGALYAGRDEESGCLFGEAFAALGSPVPAVLEGNSIATVLQNLVVNADQINVAWASRLQRRQDEGKPWGVALAKADGRKVQP